MTALLLNPFPMFYDQLGQPLDQGYIYVGEVNKDPRQFPINVYLDVAKTNIAVQPLRTINGVLSNGYKPIPIFTDVENYSVLVLDKDQEQVFYDKSSVTSNFGVTGALEYIKELTDTAHEEIMNQGFVARVYDTPSEGVAAGTGVPNGKYFNARSSDPAIYAVEYLNNNGTAQATGKTYPTLQAWTDALAAVTTTGDDKLAAINTLASQKTTDLTQLGDAKIADVAATGEQKKAQLSEIAAAVSGLNAGQEFFQTETELKATTPAAAGKVSKALDTKKVWYWNGSAWVDTGLSELDQAKGYADANPLFKPKIIAQSDNLNSLTTPGLYLQSAVPSGAVASLNYPSAETGQLTVTKADSSGFIVQAYHTATDLFVRMYTTSWGAWTSTLGSAKTYVQNNALMLYGTPIAAGTDANTLTASGRHTQPVTDNATLALNYPVAAAGWFDVWTENSNTWQVYTTRVTLDVYRRVKYSGTWSAWKLTGLDDGSVTKAKLASELIKTVPRRLEFFPVGAAANVSYDAATKTLSWSHQLLAVSSQYDVNTPRIRIPAGSVTFAGTGYETLYLDMSLVPNTGVLTDLTPLKVAAYSATGFQDNFNQLPLAKLDYAGVIRPAAGFLPITTASGSTATTAKDTFEVAKTATVCNFFLPLSNGNLMKYPLNYVNVPFDGTTANSQSDLWRMETAIEVTSDKSTVRTVVTTGEWDNAIRVQGASDHVGGWHGDEVKTLAYFMIDGVKYADNATYTGQCKELIFIQKSNVYMLNSQTDILYKRTKVMRVTKDRIRNYQKFEFMRSEQLFTAWVSMLPILRKSNPDNTGNQITDTAIRLPDYALEDVTSAGFTQIYTDIKDGDSVILSSAVSKVSAELKFSKFVGMPKPVLHISSDTPYNKIYFSAIDSRVANYNVTAGAIWELETEFKLNVGN